MATKLFIGVWISLLSDKSLFLPLTRQITLASSEVFCFSVGLFGEHLYIVVLSLNVTSSV